MEHTALAKEARARGRAAWLATCWRRAPAPDITLGIDVVRDFEFRDMQDALVRVIDRSDLPEQPRSHAMGALTVIDPGKNLATVERVLTDAAKPIGMRMWASYLLGGINRAEARAALINILPVAPERLQGAVASALVRRREGADALLNAIASGKGSARLLQDRNVTINLESSGLPNVTDRIAALLKAFAGRRCAKLSFLPSSTAVATAWLSTQKPTPVSERRPSRSTVQSAIRGNGRVKARKVGPQLDGIPGTRGLDGRLMEDILDPNRNVDQTLRVTNLALKNGQIVSGLLLREEGEVLIVADAQGKEVRVPRSSVDERSASALSPMPANLVDQIAEGDF